MLTPSLSRLGSTDTSGSPGTQPGVGAFRMQALSQEALPEPVEGHSSEASAGRSEPSKDGIAPERQGTPGTPPERKKTRTTFNTQSSLQWSADPQKWSMVASAGTENYGTASRGNMSEMGRIPRTVTTGEWLAEASLWCSWVHRGNLVAETNCDIITIHAQRLQRALDQLSMHSTTKWIAGPIRAYGAHAAPVYEATQVYDIIDRLEDEETLVNASRKAFGVIGAGTSSKALDWKAFAQSRFMVDAKERASRVLRGRPTVSHNMQQPTGSV